MHIYTKTSIKDERYYVEVVGRKTFKNVKDMMSETCCYFVSELKHVEEIVDIDHGTHDRLTIICMSDDDLLRIDEIVAHIKKVIAQQYERKAKLAEIKSRFTKEGKYDILIETEEKVE